MSHSLPIGQYSLTLRSTAVLYIYLFQFNTWSTRKKKMKTKVFVRASVRYNKT